MIRIGQGFDVHQLVRNDLFWWGYSMKKVC